MNAIIFSAVWGVLMMYAGFFVKSRNTINLIAIAGIVLLIICNVHEFISGMSLFSIDTKGMLFHSNFGLVFLLIILISTLMYFLLSGNDINAAGKSSSDLYALIFFILSGIGVVAGFKSLLMLFLGIEIVSIPLYILAGSDKSNLKSNEAALKYFLMGSFSTGLMLMGITLIYGDTGSFYLDAIKAGLSVLTPMKAAGLLLILASMAFKVSAAPFHFWTPDVYDGAPTVFTSFMATIVKSVAFYAFLHLFDNAFGNLHQDWKNLVAVIALLTLLIGNITAVFQQSVKRMLAYSSIAQAGFMMLAILSLNVFAKQGLLLYFAGYSIATLGIFAVLVKMKDHSVDAFNGLSKTNPIIALSVLVSLLSLAGIPLTAGFFAKYYMLLAVIREGHLMWLVVTAVLCAAVSIYYYFRVIQAMYFKEPTNILTLEFSSTFKWMIIINAILIIILGIHPDIILSLI
jgi:NADH-quinone oxidoreductase subunit N